ncbi:MAG: hypothetical protein LQ350_002074 [Teloschistes chrysophthalmus]|nr:MAG: hypothetical protein LQ350_002074 [Niorma chrysophthalma]
MSSETYPSIDIPGMPVYHYYIQETTLTYYPSQQSVPIELIIHPNINNHEAVAALREPRDLKSRLDTDPELANADAKGMMDAYRTDHFDCDLREGVLEDGRVWFIVILWDGSRRVQWEVKKEDKRSYKPSVWQSTKDA